LKDFIAEGLTFAQESGRSADAIMLVVRNPDSPAARALSLVLHDMPVPHVGIRVVLGEMHSDDREAAQLLDLAAGQWRILGDRRFGTAHEQLVAGGAHVWIGDCLRRDPAKRDAFELYYRSEPKIRMLAVASFEKLWARAKPVKPVAADSISPEIIAAGQGEDAEALPRNPRH
jgi:hypothetical protein